MAQALMVSLLFRILDQEISIQVQIKKLMNLNYIRFENKENNQSSS